MPPLILVAKAIPNNLDAEELYEYSIEIIKGLIRKGVQCILYACDGTETECSVQRLLKSGAETLFTYSIKHPDPRFPDIVITIAMIDGQLVAIIQDSKHGLKTARNNFFSGAKLLTMGNHIVMYSYARDLAFGPGSPLYHRDVEKTDRQDNSTALRLSSASAMVYLTKQYPDHLGVVTYLFTFGELIDAYQNRRISHGERIKMVLRARFFIDMWRSFLKSVGYPASIFYISREFDDISNILVEGLIALVVIHRDHLGMDEELDYNCYPLLPWLHSSETCEHVFGECWKLIKDFMFLDFIYMIPKLTALIQSTVRQGHTDNPRARAGGYAHTYVDVEDCDLAQLSIFPTDEEIQMATNEAWAEADSLFTMLGPAPEQFMQPPSNPTTRTQPTNTYLPLAASWFSEGEDPVLDFGDDTSETSSEWGSESEWSDNRALLQHLNEPFENEYSRSQSTDERILTLSCAATACEINNMIVA